MIYEIYGKVHNLAKRVLKRRNADLSQYKMISFSANDFDSLGYVKVNSGNRDFFINETEYNSGVSQLAKSEVYPVENLVPLNFDIKFKESFNGKCAKNGHELNIQETYEAWENFISSSVIEYGYKNAGLHYAGYIKETSQWCLPSWVWTNAAIVRYYCSIGDTSNAMKIAEILLNLQNVNGGWIVRNEYSTKGVILELAPNDSAYIANNCFLSLFIATNDRKYLQAAKKTADWIIQTARPDGFVYFGYDAKQKEWIKDRNIVDTGFTAALFAKLYEITQEDSYLVFLKRFVKTYVKLFYNKKNRCFATAIDENDNQKGGAFGRGQAWALEGLIPAYRVLGGEDLRSIIQATIDTILVKQRKDGGWAYNLMKPLMGTDCKATSVIARSVLEWYLLDRNQKKLKSSAENALKWCVKHTASVGVAKGGIFSYSLEGAVVHHMYTSTAFVYSSSYALDVKNILEELSVENK